MTDTANVGPAVIPDHAENPNGMVWRLTDGSRR
jgi:hypothetical protein